MVLIEQPYFLKNEKWYYHDEKAWKYRLTPEGKKDPEVVRSYRNFYAYPRLKKDSRLTC